MRESNAGPETGHKLTVGRFDRIAELMGIPSASFLDTYPDEVKSMKLSMMNYIKALRTRQTHPDLPFGLGKGTGHPKIDLQITPGGYPILPVPLPSENWGKKEWENLFTMYIGKHYGKFHSCGRGREFIGFVELATGGKTTHPPYKDISTRQTLFIENKYLPKKTKIKQPRNLSKLQIQQIFSHISQRQEQYGPEDAFKFKSIKRNKKISVSQYPDQSILSSPAPTFEAEPDIIPIGPERIAETLIQPASPAPNFETEAEWEPVGTCNMGSQHQHYDAAGAYVDTECDETTFALVNEELARTLCGVGLAMPVPCNGPNDGPPRYPVPCSVYHHLIEPSPSARPGPSGSALSPRPGPSRDVRPRPRPVTRPR